MVRIRISAVLVCMLFLYASYTYADDFGESDVEPTGPVTTISPESSPSVPSTTERNRVPVADAGPDQTVPTGALVVLSASASKDLDGAIVSYIWKQLSGPTVELLSSRTLHPSFSTGILPASYIFQLSVRDSAGASAIDVVTIAVRPRPIVSIVPVAVITISPTIVPPPPTPASPNLLPLLGVTLLLLIGILVSVIFARRPSFPAGTVLDAVTRVPIPLVELRFFDQTSRVLTGTYMTNEQGQFTDALSPGVYVVSATKQGYAPFSREGIVVPQVQEAPLNIAIDLMAIIPGS